MTGVKVGDRVTVDGVGRHLVLGRAHYAGAWWVVGFKRPVEAKRLALAPVRCVAAPAVELAAAAAATEGPVS